MDGRLGLAGISILFALLSACGGGGSGSSGTTGTAPGSNTGTNPPGSAAGFVYVANNLSNSISAYSVDPSTGALVTIAGSPFATGPSPRDLAVHPSGKFAYVANNAANTVSAYAVDVRTGALTSVGTPIASGAGPFGTTVHPSGKFAYVMNSSNTSEVISGYSIDAATGALKEIPGGPLSPGFTPLSMIIEPAGKFAYVTFRSEGGIENGKVVSYSVNATTGALTSIGTANTGVFPGFILLHPSGRFAFIANELSVNISAYSIDSSTGVLTEVAGSPFTLTHDPEPFTIDAEGRFLYVPRPDTNGNRLFSVLSVDSGTGALTEIAGSPFLAEPDTFSLTIHPNGKFAYAGNGNEGGGGMSVYAIDAATGALAKIRTIPAPAGSYGVRIDPSGRVAYSLNGPRVNPGSILEFTLNSTTGEPTFIGSVPTGSGDTQLDIIW